MFLTIFLAVVLCGGVTILLISAVAFVQDKKFFSVLLSGGGKCI